MAVDVRKLSSIVSWMTVAWSCAAGLAQMRPHVVPEGPLSPEEQLAKFHLPPGFEIELVASEPEIHSPLSINFDNQGRLWVTDTIEYPYPPKGPGRDALKVFEDGDGDGRYDSVSTLVDGLSMPTGAEPIPGGAVVFSVPSIFGCYDTSGNGRIDQRQVLYTEFGNVDAHGMNNGFTRWLDGWMYACHGYANTSHVQGSDGQTISMNSGNGYRFRLDGSRIEYVWHGQVNPYGIAFDSLGNLFTADCHSKPAYCLLRGAYYPSFGKPHDGLGFGPKLIEHSHGSTSISGIAYYAADQFPEDYRGRVFMGNSVTGRVNTDKVTTAGSTLVGIEQPDFVTCDDRWFRPVEIKLGPDGALYIADFYDCIIGYYEVPLTHPRRDKTRGRIWRVVYRGTEQEPRGTLREIRDLTKLDLPQLWDRLADPNLSVRTLATHEIVDRFGADAADGIRERIGRPSEPSQRAHGLWVLERLGALDDALVSRLAADQSRLVRVHLVKALAERDDWDVSQLEVADLVRSRLFDPDAFVRRAAADALGRHPDSANVPPLLRLWGETAADDTYLIHTVRMALRDQLLQPEIFGEHAHLDDDDHTKQLLDVSPGIRNAQSAEFVLTALKTDQYVANRHGELIHYATRYLPDEQIDAMADYVLSWQDSDAQQQLNVFRSFGLAIAERGEQLPKAFYPWAERLAGQLLDSNDPKRAIEGMQLVGALRLSALYDHVAQIAASTDYAAELRVPAIQACVATADPRSLELLDTVLGNPSEQPPLRRAAAFALSIINTEASREVLITRLTTAHHRLAADIAAALAGTQQGAEMLLKNIADGKASPLLLRELAVQRRLEGATVPDLSERVAKLTRSLPPQDEMIAQTIAQRRGAYLASQPNSKLGERAFTKHCGVCHQMSGEGKKFGPDLDGIGVRGLDRLLEDLLDPSRNVDPAFQTTIVITDRGLTRTGLAVRDEGQVLLLVDSEGNERRISHNEIDERRTSPLSPMASAVEKTLTAEDFNHLIRFLMDAKPKDD